MRYLIIRYSIIDNSTSEYVDGKWYRRFYSTGHYIGIAKFDIAIHFVRFSDWLWGAEFEKHDLTDPEWRYKRSWRFAILGIIVDFCQAR